MSTPLNGLVCVVSPNLVTKLHLPWKGCRIWKGPQIGKGRRTENNHLPWKGYLSSRFSTTMALSERTTVSKKAFHSA